MNCITLNYTYYVYVCVRDPSTLQSHFIEEGCTHKKEDNFEHSGMLFFLFILDVFEENIYLF